jgi:hypothetical protein
MTVIGVRFRSLEARREKAQASPQIKVNSVPKITGVRETSAPMFKEKALSVDFDFVTEYDPNIGSIRMSGEVIYLAGNSSQIMKKWKSKKELPEDMRVQILNHLFRACLVKIANIADDLQLPPPIGIPRVRPKAAGK